MLSRYSVPPINMMSSPKRNGLQEHYMARAGNGWNGAGNAGGGRPPRPQERLREHSKHPTVGTRTGASAGQTPEPAVSEETIRPASLRARQGGRSDEAFTPSIRNEHWCGRDRSRPWPPRVGATADRHQIQPCRGERYPEGERRPEVQRAGRKVHKWQRGR